MEQPISNQPVMDWEEISQIEADILRGKETEIDVIRKFFYDICLHCSANKISITWTSRTGKNNHDKGISIAVQYPWPLLKRAERVIARSAKLWKSPALLSIDKAYIYNIQGRYDLSLRELSNPDLIKIKRSRWHTFLLCNSLFHLGKYKSIVQVLQEDYRNVGDKFPGCENIQPLISVTALMGRMMRENDIIPRTIPELGEDDKDHDPRSAMMQSLSDFLIASAVNQTILKSTQKDPLLDLAEKAMADSLYEVALQYYKAIANLDNMDVETLFLIGSIQKMLTRYQESNDILMSIKEEPFRTIAILLIGQTMLNLEKFDNAETLFKMAIEANQNEYWTYFGIMHLGYVREARGDFRTALAQYQRVLGSAYEPPAKAAIRILVARTE
jgi:tetratricopeptide (TPR) repeat protein